MSEVSKVHTGPSIQSTVTHVKGVESSSICTIRAVILCMSMVSNSIYVRGVKGYFNLQHLRHALTYIAWLESPKSQLSKTFCGLKIGWILRKLWVKMCVCSFDTFDMHRHYSPQLFWDTFDSSDIDSICGLKISWILRKLWAKMCKTILSYFRHLRHTLLSLYLSI